MDRASQQAEYEKSLEKTLELAKKGMPLPKIAFARKLAFTTIESHLRRLLEDGRLELKDLLGEEKATAIRNAVTEARAAKDAGLKSIKSRLPEDVTYGEIKYVLTAMRGPRQKPPPIRGVINTYIGNYCMRKCFRHLELIRECEAKFRKLENVMCNTDMHLGEFKKLIDDDDIAICKLPPEKRRLYISWGEFERMADERRDFWGAEESEQQSKKVGAQLFLAGNSV